MVAWQAGGVRSLVLGIPLTLALAALLVIAPSVGRVYAVDVFGELRDPGEGAFIAGHRGDRALAPENTLPSFRSALAPENPMQFVEADVQLTRDGVPVLFHDVTLERTTGATGTVAEHTADELGRLDAGAWYRNDFAGTRIPTLDAFLALLARSEKKAIVELKFAWTAGDVRTVRDLIDHHGLRSRVVLATFSIETLTSLQDVAPGQPRIMLTRELPADPVPMAERFGVIALATTAQAVASSPDAVERLHSAGVGLVCYTLNSQDSWSTVIGLGVDGIITDTPGELDAWLASTTQGA